MTCIIYIIGSSWGGPTELDGRWLRAYDPEAHGGRGHVLGTPDRARALQFPDAGAALAFYRRTSAVQPLRPDGRPNRPLTAYTIEVQPYAVDAQ